MQDDAQPSQATEGLLMAPVWLSLSVEGDELVEGSHLPLTDWRIIVAPPLVIDNQSVVRSHLRVYSRHAQPRFRHVLPA